MIDLSEVIKSSDRFYDSEGNQADFSKVGGRRRFNKSTYRDMLNGHGLRAYVEPVYNKMTQTLDDIVQYQDHVTQTVRDLTEGELVGNDPQPLEQLKAVMREVYYAGAPMIAQVNMSNGRLTSAESTAVTQWMNFCRDLYGEKKAELVAAADESDVAINYQSLLETVQSRIDLANRSLLQKIKDLFS